MKAAYPSRTWKSALLFLASFMFILGAVLEAGIVPHTVYLRGPFAKDGSSKLVSVPIVEGFPGSWAVGARSDRLDAPVASTAKLWVNHTAYDKPHSPHAIIALGEPGRYSHWYGVVHLALPSGTPNDSTTVLRIEYPLQWRDSRAGYALMIAGVLALLLHQRRMLWVSPASVLLCLPSRLLLLLGYGAAGILAFYVLGCLWALVTGTALPTGALLRQNGSLEWLARTEWTLPYIVLSLALIAAAFEHIARFFGQTTARAVDLSRITLERMLRHWDIPLLIGWSIVSVSVIWTGYPRVANAQFSALLGLIPFSDAQGYYSGLSNQARDGLWQGVLLNRPLASAARAVLVFFSAYSYQAMVVLQATLFGIATVLSGRAVSRWLGLWPALVFVSFVCIVSRPFLTTALTETLGLLFALAAVPFMVSALRHQSRQLALITLSILTIALMIRMGSMLLVPAIGMWIVLAFGKTWPDRFRLTLQVVLCVGFVVALGKMVGFLYSSTVVASAGNFAFSLCGLSIGGDWSACVNRYADELAGIPNYGDRINFFYLKAIQNIVSDPLTIVFRLTSGTLGFISAIPTIMTLGYVHAPLPVWWPRATVFFVLLILGVIHALRSPRTEMWFWALAGVSIVMSSAFVFFDDGLRVMIVSYPIIGLFLAAGLSTHPHASRAGDEKLTRKGIILVALALLVMAVTPGLAHWIMAARQNLVISQESGQNVVIGGRRISGVLVIQDGAAAPASIPSMQLADFVRLIKGSGVEKFQGLVTPEIPTLPFGFITAPRAVPHSGGSDIYIVPAVVMERSDVPYWTLTLKDWYPNPTWGAYWHQAVSAEPFYPAPPR